MKILRAHNYTGVERVRSELERLPPQWLSAIDWVPWIVLPDDLDPVWTGLVREDMACSEGRTNSNVGGWCYVRRDHPDVAHFPHIFLQEWSWDAAVHEAAHAIEATWHAPVYELFRPKRALFPYMASSPWEYFACALDAFCSNEETMRFGYHRDDLAKADPEIFAYLDWMLQEGAHARA